MYFTNSFFNPFSVYKRKLSRKLSGVITLSTETTPPRGRVLLSFITHPFAITRNELKKSPHTTPWECMEIARIFLERGFNVDVIEGTNTTFIPKKKYSVIVDIHENLERLSPYLSPNCIKIFYITGAHWEYQNKAELVRLEHFSRRRGVQLVPRRQMPPSKNIEFADYATSLGSDFAKDTYAFAHKKIAQIPLLSTATFPSPEHKQFESIRKNFVWIGGGGAIHKGLDLVLESFINLSDFTLTVCGPVENESDFYSFYKKELCETSHIKFVGRIDIRGEQFKKIANNSVGLIYPSCSEGQSGSVVTGLHAGLIPLVTYQSGVDVTPFGFELKDFSVEEVTRMVRVISALPAGELMLRSIAAWQYAKNTHTKENFRKAYAEFIDTILKEKNI